MPPRAPSPAPAAGARSSPAAAAASSSSSRSDASTSVDDATSRLRAYWSRELARGTADAPPSARDRAAVLVPLSRAPSYGAVTALLCTRSSALSSHAGEVCLPGGKNDAFETDVEAALREAREEVGLTRDDAVVLASLPPMLSKGRVSVRPVVARVRDGFEPIPNDDEVAEVFTVRLERFLSGGDGYAYDDWEFTPGRTIRVHHFDSIKDEESGATHHVWGLTAVVLIRTAEIAFGRRAAFPLRPDGPGGTDIALLATSDGGISAFGERAGEGERGDGDDGDGTRTRTPSRL